MSEYPQQFAQNGIAVNSCGGGSVVSFGFDAAFVRVVKQAGASVYLSFLGATASSSGPQLHSSTPLEVAGVPVSGIGLWASATSSGSSVTVDAWALGPWPLFRGARSA